MGEQATKACEVGRRCAALRESVGLPGDAVARYLGIGEDELAAVEDGTESLTATQAERLADLYMIPLADLLEGEGLPESPLANASGVDVACGDDEMLEAVGMVGRIWRNLAEMRDISEAETDTEDPT